MSWAKLDDGFYRHPKARAAGKDGRALFVAGLCWAAAHLTDGFIGIHELGLVAAEAEVRPTATCSRLVEVGMWEVTEGGWVIHDYLDYNPTADAALAVRRKRAEAGRLGGQRSKPPLTKVQANGQANPEANAQAKSKQNRTPSPSLTNESPPTTYAGAVDNSEGGGIIAEAVELAAKRYGEAQLANGKGTSGPGLARWWLQENAEGATTRAKNLLAEYALTLTQLADALLQPNPPWLRHHRRRTPEPT